MSSREDNATRLNSRLNRSETYYYNKILHSEYRSSKKFSSNGQASLTDRIRYASWSDDGLRASQTLIIYVFMCSHICSTYNTIQIALVRVEHSPNISSTRVRLKRFRIKTQVRRDNACKECGGDVCAHIGWIGCGNICSHWRTRKLLRMAHISTAEIRTHTIGIKEERTKNIGVVAHVCRTL